MHILDKRRPKMEVALFGGIIDGTTFEHKGVVFIKCNNSDNDNACQLRNGCLRGFSHGTIVSIVKLEVSIVG